MEEAPGVRAFRRRDPEVRSVLAADHFKTHAGKAFMHHRGVVLIDPDRLADFLLAFFGIHRFGSALHDIGAAVVLRTVSAAPEGLQSNLTALAVRDLQFLRHHHVGAAKTRETGGLREATEFNRHLAGTLDFIDAVRDAGLRDVGFVGGVIQNHAAFAAGIVDPGLQRVARKHRAGRVIRVAEVDHIRTDLRELRHKTVRLRAGEVNDVRPLAVHVVTGAAGNHVRVDVNRVHRIRHGNHGVV